MKNKNNNYLKYLLETQTSSDSFDKKIGLIENEVLSNKSYKKNQINCLSFDYNKAMILEKTTNNPKQRDDLFNILNLIKKIKFLTPDILNSIYATDNSEDDNNFNLLQLATIFGGPLNKTTYCVINRKYVYTDKNAFLDKATLDFFNKSSYVLCKLHTFSEDIKIFDISTDIEYKNEKFYTLIKISTVKQGELKTLYLIPNKESYEYYKQLNYGVFLNIQKVGEILSKIEYITDKIYSEENINGLSKDLLFTYKYKTKEHKKEDDINEKLFF